MKTLEKESAISKALVEVWEWKDAVYEEIKNMPFEKKRVYFDEGLKEAERLTGGKMKKNADGSYSLS